MSSMQMPWLLTMQMSWLLTMQMSWLQTQQMPHLIGFGVKIDLKVIKTIEIDIFHQESSFLPGKNRRRHPGRERHTSSPVNKCGAPKSPGRKVTPPVVFQTFLQGFLRSNTSRVSSKALKVGTIP